MDNEAKALALGYAALANDDKLRVLALAGRNLGHSAKGVSFDYREILILANEKLLAISELQSRLAGMMLHLLDADPSRELDQVFIAGLCEAAAKVGIEDELLWALSKAMEEMQVHH